MNNIFLNSVFFGAFISVSSYFFGVFLKNRFKLALFNPLLISIIITMLFLIFGRVDYDTYYKGARYISYLLTPATVCLALPLYEKVSLLKKNALAVILGIASGVLTSLVSIFIMSLIFRLDHTEYVTLLPKSITTAIGIGVCEELNGYVTITVAVIVITGLLGNMLADVVFKIFRIEEKIARGLALGTSAHAMGTSKAMELGEIEGAMSSLSIAVAGILTVVGAAVFSRFM